MDMPGAHTSPVQGGPVGLSPMGTPKISPNGVTGSKPPAAPNPLNPIPSMGATAASGAGSGYGPSGATMNPSGATSGSSLNTKLSGLKKAEVISLLYKYGMRIKKAECDCDCCKSGDCDCSKGTKGKKVVVTADKGVPDKVKKQVSKSLDKNVEGYKAAELLVKLARAAGTKGLKCLVKKGDSVRDAGRKLAGVIKLRRAFKRLGL